MTPQQFQRLEELYYSVLERSSEEQGELLARLSVEDEPLAHELGSLLSAREEAAHFLPVRLRGIRDVGLSDASTIPASIDETTDCDCPSLTGRTIERWDIQERLGRGGMGEVYRAEHVLLQQPVAIKRLAPAFRADQEFRRRFVKEAQYLFALKHANVVHVSDVFDHGEDILIVMDYVDGESLRARLHQGRFTAREFLDIATQCCRALQAAHDKNIVHLDIKPENILITRNGEIKVCDFGIAKQLPTEDRTSFDTDAIYGASLPYAAPEILKRQGWDQRSDIYSLGVVLREVLSLIDDPATATRLDRIVRRMLELKPEHRYQSAVELQNDLMRLEEGRAPEAIAVLPLVRRYTENIEAYACYLQGRYHLDERIQVHLKKSVHCFRAAIVRDPKYALAYAGLADANAAFGNYRRAKSSALKAIELDDTLAAAHTSIGFIRMFYDRDWAGSEQAFKRALELDPLYPTAHHWYALYLEHALRFQEAIQEIRRAHELDPLSLIISAAVARVYLHAGRMDDAVRQCNKAIDLDPDFYPTYGVLTWIYRKNHMFKEALSTARKAFEVSHGDIEMLADLAIAYALAGHRKEAEEILRGDRRVPQNRRMPPYYLAAIYTALGEHDRAFEWLDRAYQRGRATCLDRLIDIDPLIDARFDSLRSDSRFERLLERIRHHQ